MSQDPRPFAVSVLLAAALLASCSPPAAKTPKGPPPTYPGSYAASCRNITTLDQGRMSAECADGKGQFLPSTLQASVCTGDIGNQNGILTCNGAVATPGAPTQP